MSEKIKTFNSCFLHGEHEGDNCPKCEPSKLGPALVPRPDDDPFITCAACGKTFQHSDAWELRVGSLVECPSCGVELQCTSQDVHRTWYWAKRESGE